MEWYINCTMVAAEPYDRTGVSVREETCKPRIVYMSHFRRTALPTGLNSESNAPFRITQKMVDNFIKEVHTRTDGVKTTVVRAVLANGFELVESSGCVSKEVYDENVGKQICMEKIKDKVWFLLGFLLQSAVEGFDK